MNALLPALLWRDALLCAAEALPLALLLRVPWWGARGRGPSVPLLWVSVFVVNLIATRLVDPGFHLLWWLGPPVAVVGLLRRRRRASRAG